MSPKRIIRLVLVEEQDRPDTETFQDAVCMAESLDQWVTLCWAKKYPGYRVFVTPRSTVTELAENLRMVLAKR